VTAKQIQKRKKIVNQKALMIKQVTWCKTDKKPRSEPFIGTTGLNIVIDNPESFVEKVSSITGDDLILLLNSLTFT
jgi:hypothetical protein